MKKALLSLAVIAASGAYVVYQDHATPSAGAGIASAAILPSPAPAVPPPPPAQTGSAAGAGDAADASSGDTQKIAADVAPNPAAAPPATPGSAVEVADVPPAQIAGPAMAAAPPPPLPLPRPGDAPSGRDSVPSVAQASSGYRDGSYQGDSANAYYGRVQVDAVVRGGQLVTVRILDYPSDRRTSRAINGRALPQLEQEAIQAQSAQIDAVSGATLTSEAFAESLDSALAQARGGASGIRGNA